MYVHMYVYIYVCVHIHLYCVFKQVKQTELIFPFISNTQIC